MGTEPLFKDKIREIVGEKDWHETGWHIIASRTDVQSMGRANWTFGDILMATKGRPENDPLGYMAAMHFYNVFLNDQETSPAVIEKLVPYMSDKVLQILANTPEDEQGCGGYTSIFEKASCSGRFNEASKKKISEVVAKMSQTVANRIIKEMKADGTYKAVSP